MANLDLDFSNGVPFDPGYASCVARVSGNVEFMYSAFNSMVSIKQKKFQFNLMYPKLVKMIEENVAFYLGCLLWGTYIKSLGNMPIKNNPCFGSSFDDDSISEVLFIKGHLNGGLNRDVKYYLNKEYKPNPIFIKIMDAYEDFLVANEGFVQTKTTEDIKLPKLLKKPLKEDYSIIVDAIQNAVEKEDLQILFTVADKVIE